MRYLLSLQNFFHTCWTGRMLRNSKFSLPFYRSLIKFKDLIFDVATCLPMYLLLLLLSLIDSLQKNTFNYQSKLSKDQILAFFRKSFQGQKRRRRTDYTRARQGDGRPSPEILDPCFQENIIYIQVFSVSRDPARNPDLQILNPETGPKLGNPALCRALDYTAILK